jgi:hypothetical protein
MQVVSRKIVSLLMLINFLVSLGAYGLGSNFLAHELDHRQALTASVDHDHAPPPGADDDATPEPLSDIEHLLLHAAGCFQPLFIGSSFDTFWGSPARTTPMLSRLLALPTVQLQPPVRPPRTTQI